MSDQGGRACESERGQGRAEPSSFRMPVTVTDGYTGSATAPPIWARRAVRRSPGGRRDEVTTLGGFTARALPPPRSASPGSLTAPQSRGGRRVLGFAPSATGTPCRSRAPRRPRARREQRRAHAPVPGGLPDVEPGEVGVEAGLADRIGQLLHELQPHHAERLAVVVLGEPAAPRVGAGEARDHPLGTAPVEAGLRRHIGRDAGAELVAQLGQEGGVGRGGAAKSRRRPGGRSLLQALLSIRHGELPQEEAFAHQDGRCTRSSCTAAPNGSWAGRAQEGMAAPTTVKPALIGLTTPLPVSQFRAPTAPGKHMPNRLIAPIALALAILLGGCGSDPSGPGRPTRSYLMGFSAFPPRSDTALLDVYTSTKPFIYCSSHISNNRQNFQLSYFRFLEISSTSLISPSKWRALSRVMFKLLICTPFQGQTTSPLIAGKSDDRIQRCAKLM